MENFCQHIEKLLAQHDYVVVPNLGGFVIQSQSAKITYDRITPPLSTVAFNPLMHHADGLLAIEIARSEQISYRLAMEYIEKEVLRFKAQLKFSNPVPFGNIGTFAVIENGMLLFAPSEKADFIPQNFQLSEVYIPTKESRKNIKTTKNITFPHRSTHFYKYAAVAIVIFSFLFVVPNKVSDVRRANTASLASISFETKAKVAIQKPVVVVPKRETALKDTLKSIVVAEKHDFHVVIASLATLESAQKFCSDLSSNEFPNAHILPPSKTYRIAIQSFKNKDEAITYMEKLRKTDIRFETAWVLCK